MEQVIYRRLPEQDRPLPRAARKSGRNPIVPIGYLLIAMPLAVLSFVLAVTLTALGLGLSIIGIGLPILYAALFIADRLHALDVHILGRMTRGELLEPIPLPKYRLRDMFTDVSLYLPVLYAIIKLPVSIVQFATTVAFSVAGFALLFTPAVYLVLQRFGIDMYEGDKVLSTLFPNFTPYQWSYGGTAIGAVLLIVGWIIAYKWVKFGTVLAYAFRAERTARNEFAEETAVQEAAPTLQAVE